jgi:hypothetical protein
MVRFLILFQCDTQGTILIKLTKLLRVTPCQSAEEPNKTHEGIIDSLKDSSGSIGNVPMQER